MPKGLSIELNKSVKEVNMKLKKITLLKWLFLPVILCLCLITVEVSGLIFCTPFCNVFCFYENYQRSGKKRNTIVDYKVRMNN